jgi:hypothetical protein
MDYRNKYLKYKKKYLELKNLLGGFTYDISNKEDMQHAILAARENGISANEINSTFDAVNNAAKKGDLATVRTELGNFNQQHENMPPNTFSEMVSGVFSRFTPKPDNLPDHLTDTQ